ncbi:DNA cytosine methyltransferase [Streptomyces sp. NPDC094437]|uniref:DNA cytosine methyltransferase n=1 Tax=Streptomyces sp. NPDC094437 TaxID=3366060 RepID=UPI00381C3C84
MAVQNVLGGSVAWHVENDANASKILARHWPDVPNLGDLTAAAFALVEPVDIATAGFPCQDVSEAGLGAGLAAGTRSGLWLHVARAICALRPSLVVIENVRGLLSAEAHSHVEPCPWCVGDRSGKPAVRALGAVLADLARLGFDAEWCCVRASEIGAPHRRERVFVIAWPAAQNPDVEPGVERGLAAPGQAARGWSWADARRRGRAPAADSLGVRPRRREGPGSVAGAARADAREAPQRDRGAAPAAAGGDAALDWGVYRGAVERWEQLTRPAPRAVDDRGRLDPPFVEWMHGLDEGHVTGVPGLGRNAQLRALGNGVVVRQADAALRLLLDRAGLLLAA